MWTRMKNWQKDESGATMVEFLVVLPLIFLWFGAGFVFFDAFTVSTTAKRSTYTISDILSRLSVVTDENIEDIARVFQALSGEGENTSVRVSTIRGVGSDLEVIWSTESKYNGNTFVTSASAGPSEDRIDRYVPQLAEQEEMIMVETFRPYDALFDWVGIKDRDLESVSVVFIRFSPVLANDDQPEPAPGDTGTDPGDIGLEDGTPSPDVPDTGSSSN